ncbi:MAG: hypothetical protein U0271_47360 [Polyangiaceae bacterium]
MSKVISISILASAAAVFALLSVGCGDEDRPSCDEIMEACHSSTTTEGQDCHEFSEDEATTEGECADRKADCLAICQ